MIAAQVADLIGDDSEQGTFRGVTITVRRTEAYHQREMLSAGFRDGADFELYMTDGNVAGGGWPKADEAITLSDSIYVITGVRPSAAQAFFTLSVRKANR